MAGEPKLTICVPSRNRQFYFKKTIEGLLRNWREGVEFVFADNSDDPSIINDFIRDLGDDPRIVYLPSADRVLSMMDNWERTIEAATGDWVTVIGDDDYIDPAVVDVLSRSVDACPELEAFSWGVAPYVWPTDDNPQVHSILVPYNSFVVKVPRNEPYKRMFGWHEANAVPTCGYSIYHSAVRRSMLERLKKLYGGKHFTHPVIDYDMAMKVIYSGKHFGFCQRVFSIMGSCPESNSYAIGKLADMKKKIELFYIELGRNFEEDDYMRDFPFTSALGVTASIAVAQQWFRTTYNVEYSGWEKGFAQACAKSTEAFRDRESFDLVKSGYDAAFGKWKSGRFKKYYEPVFRDPVAAFVISGSRDNGIFVRTDVANVKTPEEIYGVISDMSPAPESIEIPADGLKYPWEQVMHTADGPPRPIQILQRRVA